MPPKSNFYCIQLQPQRSASIHHYEQLLLSSRFKNQNFFYESSVDRKILILVESFTSKVARQLVEVFEYLRIKYRIEIIGKNPSTLINVTNNRGKYSIIIFDNLHRYFNLDRLNRDHIDHYCKDYDVAIIGFASKSERNISLSKTNDSHSNVIFEETLGSYPIKIVRGYHDLKDYQINCPRKLLRILRSETIFLGPISETDWLVFKIPNNSMHFVSIAQALQSKFFVDTYPGGYRYSSWNKNPNISLKNVTASYDNYRANLLTTVLLDIGSLDGVKKLFFGSGIDFWLNKLLFIDLLGYLSNERLSQSLDRYIQIDIDDIFVGEKGTRMKKSDVESLIDFQDRLRMFVPNFTFNLGYSGKYFHRGYPQENEGDDYLLQNSDRFRWFCHTFSHSQAHLNENQTLIENELLFNQKFATNNNLVVEGDYIVSPHHSGVYPIHEPLYDAWRKIWKVRVTSTEEYPHLRPAYARRGFIHNDVMVLPRQTCGLYTHTIFLDRYPGGRDKLEKSIFGGDLFFSFIYNQVNVFMTHQSNYANDRLALYTFETVFKVLKCWTNLRLHTLSPVQMAKKYFQIYPEDRNPLWTNPCDDKRHYNIWSVNKSCSQFPKFLILGPQKTGSTALHQFLSLHPSLKPSLQNNQTFEEIQFFSTDRNYLKGIDWYLNFFPSLPEFSKAKNDSAHDQTDSKLSFTNTANNHTQRNYFARTPPDFNSRQSKIYFEKSSTYFDGESVPMRVHMLLPHAKLVIILINPIHRAYSWYHHMRAHNDSIALEFSFFEIITLNPSNKINLSPETIKKIRTIRNRCLNPGHYAIHLERWLSFFPSSQIMIVDGDELRQQPAASLEKLQHFLELENKIDYSQKLIFDTKKGFFCPVIDSKTNTTKCLGKSKGRSYPKIDVQSNKFLHKYFWRSNIQLSKLLHRLRMKIPRWLKLELLIKFDDQRSNHPK
ncbi:hypothetical protein SSS_08178 [Sarcoptes scabiei]|nr:hypothetical protein SSS_08178 [Sarcoptes scabiei]